MPTLLKHLIAYDLSLVFDKITRLPSPRNNVQTRLPLCKEFMKAPRDSTIKRLFALSGNRCAFPKCYTPLVDQTSD